MATLTCDCCWLLFFQYSEYYRILLVGIFIWIFMGDLPSTRQNVLRSQVGSTSHQSIRPPLSTRPPLMHSASRQGNFTVTAGNANQPPNNFPIPFREYPDHLFPQSRNFAFPHFFSIIIKYSCTGIYSRKQSGHHHRVCSWLEVGGLSE